VGDLATWVKKNPDLKFLGEGINRKAFLMPDGKVFKMETSAAAPYPETHNTDFQIDIYSTEPSHYFPRIFAYGNNWIVEEKVELKDLLLDMNRWAWEDAAKRMGRCESLEEIEALAEEDYYVGKVLGNRRMKAIVELFLRNGLELCELRLDNLGQRRNGQIVVLDYERPA